MAMLLWTIWFRRNSEECRFSNFTGCLERTANAPGFQKRANSTASTPVSTHVPTRSRWSPPPSNFWKVNFDGATFKDIGKVGLGVVIRDNQGQTIAALSEQIPLPFSSDVVEALAVARAISFAL